MRGDILLLLSAFIISLCQLTRSASIQLDESTREEILESRRRRRKSLEALLLDVKDKLADHNNGIRILTENEKADLEKKADIFQKKLDTMPLEIDEREVERILQREKIRNERFRERRARHSEL